MTTTSMLEAWRPASRPSTAIKEYEILRVAASFDSKNREKAVDDARREILGWAQNRSGSRLPREAWNLEDFAFFSGGRNSVGVRLKNDEADLWAIRADDPDKEVPGRVWTTEVVVASMGTQTPRFSARLLTSTPEDELDIEPHAPGFIHQVVERFELSRAGVELSAHPWTIDGTDEAQRLADLLVDPERKIPFFVLTIPDWSDRPDQPLIDSWTLARATSGIGRVVVVLPNYTWVLTERFGRIRSVYGGAVRAYLPGFAEDSNPYSHRLVLANSLRNREEIAQTQHWMRWLAASESVRHTRMGRDILSFAAIRAATLEARQNALESQGASEAVRLKAANERIDALEKELTDEKATEQYFAEEHQKAEIRAQAAEEQLRASAFRIQQLSEQLKSRGQAPDESLALPSDWHEFANWCDANLAGRVVISPRARNAVRAPEFEDVTVAAQCLLWLANEGRDRRIEGGDGSLGEYSIAEGIRNSHCGGDQYDSYWQGQRHTVDWHIKNGGNTRNPRRCLRIYYFWDPATQQIVVADMPAHRRTSAT